MPLPITNRLKEAVEYVNYHYYSKEKKHKVIPLTSSLPIIKGDEPNDAAVPLRLNHGILHAMAAMESITHIHDCYEKNYNNHIFNLQLIANYFHISFGTLLEYVQLAALFHNTGKENGNTEYCDEISSVNCKKYMLEKLHVENNLADYISNAIRYRKFPRMFLEAHKDMTRDLHFKDSEVDIIHQLVNTAAALEDMCHQDVIEATSLPIAAHARPIAMQVDVIPHLVIPHRQRIIAEGRNRCEARIENCSPIHFDDSDYELPPQGTSKQLYLTYQRQNQIYDLTVENITLENLDRVVQRALRGIETYQTNNNTSPKLRLHNQGIFKLRYHGKAGENRAAYFQNELANGAKTPYEKVKLLYAIFANQNGPTLKEEVMRSFNNMNEASIFNQLSALLRTLAAENHDEIQTVNDEVVKIINGSTLK